jgi:hypothetical protein
VKRPWLWLALADWVCLAGWVSQAVGASFSDANCNHCGKYQQLKMGSKAVRVAYTVALVQEPCMGHACFRLRFLYKSLYHIPTKQDSTVLQQQPKHQQEC